MFIDLSMEQIQIILKHHEFMESLVSGSRQPTTVEQIQFVSVVEGKAEASTKFELTYKAWKLSKASIPLLEKENKKRMGLSLSHTVSENRHQTEKAPSKGLKLSEKARLSDAPTPRQYENLEKLREQDGPKSPPKPDRDQIPDSGILTKPKHARKAEEPWGSREDWKRDRDSW